MILIRNFDILKLLKFQNGKAPNELFQQFSEEIEGIKQTAISSIRICYYYALRATGEQILRGRKNNRKNE